MNNSLIDVSFYINSIRSNILTIIRINSWYSCAEKMAEPQQSMFVSDFI